MALAFAASVVAGNLWTTNAAHAADAGAPSWRPAACPPPAQKSGPSSLKVSGACPFEQKAAVDCEFDGDDFNIDFTRPAKSGAKIFVHVSIEHYRQPGTSKDNEMAVFVQHKSKIYRWVSEKVEVTVAPDASQIIFRAAHLEPEPVLIGCTGPATNYQCDGRGDEPELLKTQIEASGMLRCKPGGKRPGPNNPVTKND